MSDFKIGVIGVDRKRRGGHAWPAHCPAKGYRIVSGADINPDALKDFQKEFGTETFITSDYKEMLKRDLDAVFIMTPDFLHEEQAIAVLEAGVAVYLEKPMAITIQGCDRILETAMKTGSKLFIGHNMRHYPAVLKMKEIIDSGVIGEVRVGWCRHFIDYGGVAYFRDWHAEQRYVNGLLLQKGAHDIDVMHWLMGSYTKSVVGMGSLSVYNQCERRKPDEEPEEWDFNQWPPMEGKGFSPLMDVEDHNMLLMQLENGAQACYMQCHFTPDSERNYTFIGTKGRLENVGDSGDCEIHVWTQRGRRSAPDIIHRLSEIPGGHGGSDVGVISSFLDFARHGRPTNTSPVAARQAVAAGVMGHDSMREGFQRKDIPVLSADLVEYFDSEK